MKLKLCGRLLQCFFILWIFVLFSFSIGNCESESLDSDSDSSGNPNPHVSMLKSLECSLNCEDLTVLQEDNRELKKSHKELIEQVKSLSKQFDELKRDIGISWDRGVWLLTPKLRGREPGSEGGTGEPGRKGEAIQEQQGQNGGRGATGQKGEICQVQPEEPAGQNGTNGTNETDGQDGDGEKGKAATTGPPSLVGPNGISGVSDPQSIKSCGDAMKLLPFTSPRLSIYPHQNNRRVQVLCDFETGGGGWTIIQRRSNGPRHEFDRTWADYEKGFGSPEKNFWLGLENIRALTQNRDQELRIEMEDFEGRKKWVEYSSFFVSDASDFYRLWIDGFSGNTGNGLINSDFNRMHNGQRFSAKDKDNDKYSGGNCAARFGGGWWYNACAAANLNGLFREKEETVPYAQGVLWSSWKGYYYSLAKTEMKIRKRK